jgi:NADH dehydrogenase
LGQSRPSARVVVVGSGLAGLFHLVYRVGFKNLLSTLLHWAVRLLGRGGSERTVTQQQIFARAALDQFGDQFAPTRSSHREQDPHS